MKRKSSAFGVDRTIEIGKSAYGNCVRVVGKVSGGRQTSWEVCVVGPSNSPASLSITRSGRRGGGFRGSGKMNAGITACSSRGQNSKCVLAPHGVSLFPGGGAKLRKAGVTVLNGYKHRRRNRKR